MGLSVNSRDVRQSTPLHWACYAGAESAAAYLLAWKAEANAVDIQLMTPLHLAVRSAADMGSTRSVRHLLMKGADRRMRDFEGLTPYEHAMQLPNGQSKNELLNFLVRLNA